MGLRKLKQVISKVGVPTLLFDGMLTYTAQALRKFYTPASSTPTAVATLNITRARSIPCLVCRRRIWMRRRNLLLRGRRLVLNIDETSLGFVSRPPTYAVLSPPRWVERR